MKFIINKKVFEKFTTLTVTIPIILGFDNSKSKDKTLVILREAEAKLRKEMTLESLWQDKRITSYLDCFKDFGVDPKKFVPAHVALASRVLEGKNLPDINPMVNLYNAMSIKYLTPFGGENLDSLYGDFVLKIAQGGEEWIPIGGSKSKPAVTGELVWGDDFDLSTRALNWRQCDRTKMTQRTKNGYFVMDGFSDVNRENIKVAVDEFITLATKLFGGKTEVYTLDSQHTQVQIPFKTQKIIKTDKKSSEFKRSKIDKKAVRTSKTSELPELFQKISWEGENTLSFHLRQIILRATNEVMSREVIGNKLTIKIEDVKTEHPKQENYGDYSTSIALVIAGQVGMKTRELASKIVDELNKYINTYQTRTEKTDSLSHQDNEMPLAITKIEPKVNVEALESASVAGPGFINLTIRKDYLSTELAEVLNDKYAVILTQIKGKKIAVEYTDPNPFKELHLGHFYSNIIGESISRLFEMCGATVWRADFYGDVGMHVCKSVWGMMKKMEDEQVSLEDLEVLPLAERQKFLGEGYALGVREYEKNEADAEKIRDINYLIYVAAQDILKNKKGWKPIINYKQYIQGKNNDFEKIYKVYEAGLRWSLEYFESIYKRLGTKFDGYYPESWVGEYGMKLVEEGLKKGVLEKHNGAVIFKGEKYGLHTRVFVNKLGLPTYESKDFGLAPAKYQDFKYDASIIVTGKEIKEYFQVVLTVMRLIVPELGKKTLVLSHGMVRLPEGKMSSRRGNVITVEGLLDEARLQALKIMKNIDVPESEKQIVAEAVAMGAIRYALLKGGPENDVVFDFGKSVSFEGDSGPYLMYTYARCKSVLRKADTTTIARPPLAFPQGVALQINTEELSLLRTLYKFSEVVTEAARNLSPNLICTFLFDLAQKYNLFYNKHSILNLDNRQSCLSGIHYAVDAQFSQTASGQTTNNKAQINHQPSTTNLQQITNFRLALTEATSIILRQGLDLLGIETVERM